MKTAEEIAKQFMDKLEHHLDKVRRRREALKNRGAKHILYSMNCSTSYRNAVYKKLVGLGWKKEKDTPSYCILVSPNWFNRILITNIPSGNKCTTVASFRNVHFIQWSNYGDLSVLKHKDKYVDLENQNSYIQYRKQYSPSDWKNKVVPKLLRLGWKDITEYEGVPTYVSPNGREIEYWASIQLASWFRRCPKWVKESNPCNADTCIEVDTWCDGIIDPQNVIRLYNNSKKTYHGSRKAKN